MRTVALPLLLALLGAGCVTVRNAPPRFALTWPPAEGSARRSISLGVAGGATVDGRPSDLGPILDAWGMATERAYQESALFAEVSLRRGRGDLRVAVELRADVSQSDLLTTLSYLTLLVLPHVVTTDITMTTRVETADGTPLGTVEVHGRSSTWYELLLLPFAFFDPHSVTPGIVYDLDRLTIAALHARGVF